MNQGEDPQFFKWVDLMPDDKLRITTKKTIRAMGYEDLNYEERRDWERLNNAEVPIDDQARIYARLSLGREERRRARERKAVIEKDGDMMLFAPELDDSEKRGVFLSACLNHMFEP